MKTPKTFYKFREFNINTLKSLCEDTLYFSNPGDFNDPLDCSPMIECDSSIEDLEKLFTFFTNKRISIEALQHIKSSGIRVSDSDGLAYRIGLRETDKELSKISHMANNSKFFGPDSLDNKSRLLASYIRVELGSYYERGVCCFSSTYTSPLLWSHYGQQHQGICIGYTYANESAETMEKVVYGGNRAIKTSTLCRAFLNRDLEAQICVDRDVLLRKARGWKYESEWRLISDQGVQRSPLLITDITFGLRCDMSIMHTVIKALERRSGGYK